ncbi:MAG: hypothetical protein JSV17_18440 [Candidatus Aminicenantes bacterium]|nr:MAG: hypothetical protein JSV17_18440 [Candidatus Aminicenantes bacterium]
MKRINKKNAFLIGMSMIMTMGLTVLSASAGEEFAPVVKLPEKLENRGMWVNMIKNWVVPSKEEVGIPAYPGSVIVALQGKSWMEANGEKMDTLPSLTLATKDEPAKVTAFYKEKLADWKHKNQMNMFDIFWTGKETFNNMDVTESATTPNLVIMEAFSAQTDFLPGAKTAITIVYKPAK